MGENELAEGDEPDRQLQPFEDDFDMQDDVDVSQALEPTRAQKQAYPYPFQAQDLIPMMQMASTQSSAAASIPASSSPSRRTLTSSMPPSALSRQSSMAKEKVVLEESKLPAVVEEPSIDETAQKDPIPADPSEGEITKEETICAVATVLNYGQGIFEGLKAFRTSKGRTVLFRPEKNAQRMASGAERFLMPPVPKELFLEMCYEAVRANADWVPPEGKGSLYLRPLLMGSGAALGVGPSPEFTFVIYVAPVGSYFSGGGARLRVETSHHRAADLGVGYVKAAGNYAPCFQPQKDAKEKGFSDVLYLDPSGKRVEEAAASNFFCVTKDGKLKTPALGTILAGVTRDSILQLARRLATQSDLINSVEETSITLDEILQAKEAFVTGTAAAVTPVGHVASVLCQD
ncbi:unnamed protein product [Durusdinium trenchii]|uniref:Branched-chain-amino-acid aminotransferase n=1 Tax=Durusdinium trenchii TaxID=1381693 RepID=A0ABP0P852_9DINO